VKEELEEPIMTIFKTDYDLAKDIVKNNSRREALKKLLDLAMQNEGFHSYILTTGAETLVSKFDPRLSGPDDAT
jgi:hypothetical protein